MYSKALRPEIMSTMLPRDSPADALSKPEEDLGVSGNIVLVLWASSDRDWLKASHACTDSRSAAPMS